MTAAKYSIRRIREHRDLKATLRGRGLVLTLRCLCAVNRRALACRT